MKLIDVIWVFVMGCAFVSSVALAVDHCIPPKISVHYDESKNIVEIYTKHINPILLRDAKIIIYDEAGKIIKWERWYETN